MSIYYQAKKNADRTEPKYSKPHEIFFTTQWFKDLNFTWNIEAFSSISKMSTMSTDTSIIIFEEFWFDGGRGAIYFWYDSSGLIRRHPTSSLLSLQSVLALHRFSISMHNPFLQVNSDSLQVDKVSNVDLSSLQFSSFLKYNIKIIWGFKPNVSFNTLLSSYGFPWRKFPVLR